MPFVRRGRFWITPSRVVYLVPRRTTSRRPSLHYGRRGTFSEPGRIGLAPVPPADFTLFGRIRPNLVAGALRGPQILGDIRADWVTGSIRPNQIHGGNSVARTLSPGSVELVWAEVTFLGLTAADISTVTAQIAFSPTDTPGAWQDPDDTTREDLTGYNAARLSISKSVTAVLQPGETSSTYRVWAKLSNGTIVPCEQYTVR
jgi:hypothetical protein